jgi:hypothetical protein
VSDTVVSVSYDRKFADGNYGSEGLSLSWTVTYEDETDEACNSEIVEARCNEIAAKLRIAVLQELSRSQARQVAWAAQHELELPITDSPPDPLEDMPF